MSMIFNMGCLKIINELALRMQTALRIAFRKFREERSAAHLDIPLERARCLFYRQLQVDALTEEISFEFLLFLCYKLKDRAVR